MTHQTYLVQWEMHVDAETPLDAARAAWGHMRAEHSTANVFDVLTEDGDATRVDLQAEFEALRVPAEARAPMHDDFHTIYDALSQHCDESLAGDDHDDERAALEAAWRRVMQQAQQSQKITSGNHATTRVCEVIDLMLASDTIQVSHHVGVLLEHLSDYLSAPGYAGALDAVVKDVLDHEFAVASPSVNSAPCVAIYDHHDEDRDTWDESFYEIFSTPAEAAQRLRDAFGDVPHLIYNPRVAVVIDTIDPPTGKAWAEESWT